MINLPNIQGILAVLISSTNDSRIFTEAVSEANIIINSAINDQGVKEHNPNKQSSSGAVGHCIRCGIKIPFNLAKPFCSACYTRWAEFENPDYVENYCHICGKPAVTAMSRPQCNACDDFSG